MSSYNRTLVLFFVAFFILGCSKSSSNLINYDYNYKSFAKEDRYIMFALEYDRTGNKEEAKKIYRRLYENTLKEEYLLEYIKELFTLKKHDEIINYIEQNKNVVYRYEENIKKIYILSLIQKKDFAKAQVAVKELVEKYDNSLNQELLGTIYLQQAKYKEAKEIFSKMYKKTLKATSLINLVNVMYIYLHEKKSAINYLESHIKLYGCDNLICTKLLGFYQEQNDIDGIISVLKKTYKKMQDDRNELALEKVYKLLMYYLMKKDIDEAIAFLEDSEANNDKLLELYRNNNQYEKAYKLVNKLYEQSSNIDYLAQIAILEFEKAKDKKKVLKSVIKKFEDVLVILDNHIYQNYLGYILIDFDIDIKKGKNLVEKALEKDPNNLAYLDSLAWAQYKLNDCKNAYINMKKVVDRAGLEDKEIKEHWKAIKECSK